MELHRYGSEEARTGILLESWQAIGGEALHARGSFHVCLSAAPPVLALLRALATSGWAWRATTLWPSDEFWAGHGRKGSCQQDIYAALYPHRVELQRWRLESTSPTEAAREYEQRLKRQAGDPPRFDLMVLTPHPDGSVAGLHPGTTASSEQQLVAMANPVPLLNTIRLTLCSRAFTGARSIWLLTSGSMPPERGPTVLDPTSLRARPVCHHLDLPKL